MSLHLFHVLQCSELSQTFLANAILTQASIFKRWHSSQWLPRAYSKHLLTTVTERLWSLGLSIWHLALMEIIWCFSSLLRDLLEQRKTWVRNWMKNYSYRELDALVSPCRLMEALCKVFAQSVFGFSCVEVGGFNIEDNELLSLFWLGELNIITMIFLLSFISILHFHWRNGMDAVELWCNQNWTGRKSKKTNWR